MPEHVHLLINEPPAILLALFLKSFKQETSKKLKGARDHFWQPRYYDFNVRSPEERSEKIRYIHRNPVHRGLVSSPEEAATVFDDPLSTTLLEDQHSFNEDRFITVCESSRQRLLFVVYTETTSGTRLIGARLATATERNQYEEVY